MSLRNGKRRAPRKASTGYLHIPPGSVLSSQTREHKTPLSPGRSYGHTLS